MMAEPPRRKVVTATSTASSTPGPSQPRIRAKVDPSALATPPTSRPGLRSAPSSSSLTARVSATRPYPPAPSSSSTRDAGGSSTPGLPRRTSSPAPITPVIRAKATPIQRSATSSNTPTPTPSSNSVPRLSTFSRTFSAPSQPVEPDRSRPKVKTAPNTGLFTPPAHPRSRSKSPAGDVRLGSGPGINSAAPAPPLNISTQFPESTRIASASAQSPEKQLSPLPQHLFNQLSSYVQHPTASCPPSPPTGSRPAFPAPSTPTLPQSSTHRLLPIHPGALVTDLYANAPQSPELRTVGLPALTPRSGSVLSDAEAMSRGNSSDSRRGQSVIGMGIRLGPVSQEPEAMAGGSVDVGRWSGSSAVDSLLNGTPGGAKAEDGGTLLLTPNYEGSEAGKAEEEDSSERAEEAKVNRKIADLEISNASLMAINRSLEATKAKQRAEILKLRRALRESTDAPASSLSAGLSSRSLLSPPLQPISTDEEDPYASDEVEDPEIEERWEKIQDLVTTMQKRADSAVRKALEEVKVGQRVLGWTEMEGGGEGDESVDLTPATGTPEG